MLYLSVLYRLLSFDTSDDYCCFSGSKNAIYFTNKNYFINKNYSIFDYLSVLSVREIRERLETLDDYPTDAQWKHPRYDELSLAFPITLRRGKERGGGRVEVESLWLPIVPNISCAVQIDCSHTLCIFN